MSDTCPLAADLLEAEAAVLRVSHNVDPQHPTWEDEPEALAAHDMAMDLARQLRNISNYLLLLEGQYAAEKERADYAWRNTAAIDKHRMAKEHETTAQIDALRAMIDMMRVDMAIAAGILERDGDEHGVAWNLRNAIAHTASIAA